MAKLSEGPYRVGRQFFKPYPSGSLEGGWEGMTHNFVRDPLKAHHSLEGLQVVERVFRSIKGFQRRHSKLKW